MAEEVFIFPCSFAQQRLWFLDQLEPNSAYYNIPLAVRLRGRLNVPVLERCLREVVRRHETLRTRFQMVDGQPMQLIVPSLEFEFPVRDLGEFGEQDAIRIATEEIRKPFDLTIAPLLRALLLRLRDDDYILTLTLHHIVGDAWSLGILIREITALYEAFLKGEPSPLPELSVQYADFADWEQQWLQGELLEEQLSYWEKKLAGELPVSELPADHPRPRVSAHRGANYSFKLPLDVTEKLKTLARNEEATLFMTLLAVFNVMLNRYTGLKDITVGVPNANRNQLETEGLIGFFVNTLVMRTDISGEPSFRKLLGRVRDTVLEADIHREVPFEKLVERLQPERNLAQNPLFQVMFYFQNQETDSLTWPEVKVDLLKLDTATAKFDLILAFSETKEGLAGSVQYDTELFEAETVSRMMGHYQTLLDGVLTNPEQLVSRLSMLTAAETQQLAEWNDTGDDSVPQQCLHDLFAVQVRRTPDALAVSSGAHSWTYRELNTRADQVANHLRKLGVGPDVRVGLCLEPSLEMAAGVLGVLKAGGAYVPLDPAYPRERLALMMRDSRARVVLTQSWLVQDLPDGIELECLDTSWEALAAESENPEPSDVLPDNLAYVIYTSGSTGVPKGVAVSHWPVVNLIWWQIREPGFAASGSTAQFHSFSFDVSCQEMFSTWATGGTLVMIPEDERRDVDRLLEVVTESGVERLFLPPAAMYQLAEASLDQTLPNSLRQMVVAGEQLQIHDSVVRLFEKLENCVLHNQYGPTENAVITTAFSLSGSPADWSTTPPIGRPLPNTQVHLLNEQ
ncbi:MAG TPA: condensation domain-containing protein, partial [Pyrinomonadaceae bacterium]